MAPAVDEWRPGSFTKNFSWGTDQGLKELHEVIRTGFDGKLENVPRADFRERVRTTGRPDYIPINFFLFNKTIDGRDHLIVDELVFQALNFPHSRRFDQLALFSFILSIVGSWKGAKPYQERPALWAHHYVADRLAQTHGWDASKISADDIERFVKGDKRYVAKGARKLATNLYYLFQIGGVDQIGAMSVSRWWADAIFLALDRAIESRSIHRSNIEDDRYDAYLAASGFFQIAGKRSIEKDLAAGHVIRLFRACGGRFRFSEESVRELTSTLLEDVQNWLINDPEPIAALHPSNPNLVKTIPRPCAMLAQSVGFEVFNMEELIDLSVSDLVKRNLDKSLSQLRERGISAKITTEELMRLMRGE